MEQDLVSQVGMAVVTVVVPMLVALVKTFIPRIPKWTLPILATAFGPVTDFAVTYLMQIPAMGWKAALLGLAGVGLREFVDQTKKATGIGV